MWKASAILQYSSLTLVKPWMRPVGLPWASWVWKISRGRGGEGGGGPGGGGGGEVGGGGTSSSGGGSLGVASFGMGPGSCFLLLEPWCVTVTPKQAGREREPPRHLFRDPGPMN